VGEGIAASGVPREQIFLTTKIRNTDHKDPEKALEESLQKLGTTYLDLCKRASSSLLYVLFVERGSGLLHWPAPMTKDYGPDRTIDWLDTWKAMEGLYRKYPDKLKAIGNVAQHVYFRSAALNYLIATLWIQVSPMSRFHS
jgi:glycerol 2-dehydrogenase (NADP+)